MADNKPLIYAGVGAAAVLIAATIYYTGKDIEKEENPQKPKISHDNEIICAHDLHLNHLPFMN